MEIYACRCIEIENTEIENMEIENIEIEHMEIENIEIENIENIHIWTKIEIWKTLEIYGQKKGTNRLACWKRKER